MGHERASIASLRGYTPGRQPTTSGVVKLNTNENPYPPAPAILRELGAIDAEMLRRYPPPSADTFRRAAAMMHGVEPDCVVAVNGGDELLRLALTTFVDPGTPVALLDPSYSLYPVLAAIHGSPALRVPCEADWSWPRDLARRVNDAGARLLFVVNPHAPSGRLAPAAAVAELAAAFTGVLVVDEAYVDFVDPLLAHDLVPLARERDDVLLLRTLSKGYSLAGLRVGYGIGAPSLVGPIREKTRDSYNLDAVAQRLATVALEHRAEAAESWRLVRQERERLSTRLAALGCALAPSQANFVLAGLPGGHRAVDVLAALEAHAILVRHFDEPRLRDALRITVGTPEQNDRLLAALAEIFTQA